MSENLRQFVKVNAAFFLGSVYMLIVLYASTVLAVVLASIVMIIALDRLRAWGL